MYFPDSYPKGRVCDREFMFNVVNTLHPDVVTRIREHALEVRFVVNDDVQTKETILMTDHWKQELGSLPMRTTVSQTITNTNVQYRKKDGWFNCLSKSRRSLFNRSQERSMKLQASSRNQRLIKLYLKLVRTNSMRCSISVVQERQQRRSRLLSLNSMTKKLKMILRSDH